MLDEVREAVERVNAGNFSEEDIRAIASAIQAIYSTQATGKQAISISGGTTESSLVTGDYNQIYNTNYYGVDANELLIILRKLQPLYSQNNPINSPQFNHQTFDGSLVLEIDPEVINKINTYLEVIDELQKTGRWPNNQQISFAQLRDDVMSIKEVEEKINSLVNNSRKIIQNSIKLLEDELKDLSNSPDEIFRKTRSQVCLQENINLLREWRDRLDDSKVVAEWLNQQRLNEKLANRLSRYVLDTHPQIQGTLSPQKLEAFNFSIEQFIEQLSHCLIWGRTNILEYQNTTKVLENEAYSTAFEHLKTLIPHHLPENGIENLQEYIDFLVQKIPSYQHFSSTE